MSAEPTEPFFASRWVPAPGHVRELGLLAGLPAGFRAAGVAGGPEAERQPGRRAAGLRRRRAVVSAARFTSSGTPRRRSCSRASAAACESLRAVLVNSGSANAATGRRGIDDAAKTQGAAAAAAGGRAGRGRARLDRRDQPPAARRRRYQRDPAGARRSCGADGRRRLPAGDPDDRPFDKRASLEVELPSGTVRAERPVQGRRDDLAPLRDDALLRADRRAARAETADLLLGVCVQRSLRPRLGRWAALDQRHRDPDVPAGPAACASSPRARTSCASARRCDALLRELAMKMVADGEGAARIARVLVRGGTAEAEARRPGHRQLAAGEGRAARRRPQLGPDRAGRRSGAARHRAAARRHLRSRARRSAPPARRSRSTSTALAGRSPATRSSTRSGCPARARRPRSSSPTSRTTT